VSKLEAMMSISYGRWVRMPNWQQRGLVGQQKVRRELGPCNLMIPLLIWPPMRTCFCGGAQNPADRAERKLHQPPDCFHKQQEKLEVARHERLVMIQHNKLAFVRRIKLVLGKHGYPF